MYSVAGTAAGWTHLLHVFLHFLIRFYTFVVETFQPPSPPPQGRGSRGARTVLLAGAAGAASPLPGESARGERGRLAGPVADSRALCRERAQGVLTRLLAPAARLGTDTAVLVMVCMPLTLLATRAARLEARLHNAAREFRHELRLPAQNSSGRHTDVAAVLTESDAAQHHLHVRCTQAGVSARRAALRAIEARVDARDQRGGLYLNGSWMRLQHLPSVGHVHLHLRPRSAFARPIRQTDTETCGVSNARSLPARGPS